MGNKKSTQAPAPAPAPAQEQQLAKQQQQASQAPMLSEWDDILMENEESCPGLVKSIDIRERDLMEQLSADLPNVDPTRLSFCSLLSNLAYKVKTKQGLRQALLHHMSLVGEGEDFKTVHHCHVRADKCWDHRLLTVIKGRTLYVAWKGTDNLRDLVRDISCLPKRCMLWSYAFPNIMAHSGMVDTIEHQYHYLPDLLKLLDRYPVDKIVFTGHSLGAGLAQVALMAAYGQQAMDYYHWPDKNIRDKARRLLQNVTFSCQAFASPMIFSMDSDVKLGTNEEAILTKFQSNCNMLFFEQDLIPRVPAFMDYFMPAMRAIIKQKGQDSGKQHAVGPTTQLLFGKMAKAGAKRVVWPMMEGAWDMETRAAFETYKHIATLIHITTTTTTSTTTTNQPHPEHLHLHHHNGQPSPQQVTLIHAQQTTHEELMKKKFDHSTSGVQLLQMHRILPKCFGRYMIAKKKALLVPSSTSVSTTAAAAWATSIAPRVAAVANTVEDTTTTLLGRKIYSGGSSYVGELEQNKRCGRGTYSLANGDWYVGDWHQDQINGFGTYYWSESGDWYVGGFKNGWPHGKGYHSAMGKGNWYQGQLQHSPETGDDPNPLSRQDMTLREWQSKFSLSPSRRIRLIEQ